MQILLLTALVYPMAGAIGTSVNLTPVKDNSIYSKDVSLSNGQGDLAVGATNKGHLRRALISFDIASSGIPAGSQINSVTLTLQSTQTGNSSNTISIHKVTQNWGEGSSMGGGNGDNATTNDATWTHRFFNSANTWNAPGGDFSTTSSGSQTVTSSGSYTWNSTSQMVADVQDWLDNPSNNFGWILIGSESITDTTKRFTSREGTNNQPTLTVDFTPIQAGCQDVFCGEDIPGFPGWLASPWYENYNVESLPWIFHDEHGWQFLSNDSTEDVIFVWDLGLGQWVFLNENSYRWIFIFGGENTGWVFTFSDNTSIRRFFQRTDGVLFSVPPDLPVE